jgi:hypothetical protein
VFCGKSLEFFDGDNTVDLTAAAGLFTGMIADVAQHLGKRGLFPDDCHGLGELLFTDETKIPGDINLRRAKGLAGDQGLPAFPAFYQFLSVSNGAGGADLGAGPAESASGLGQGTVEGGADPGFLPPPKKGDDSDTTQFVAGPDTAAAADAAGKIMNKEWVSGLGGDGFNSPPDPEFFGYS